MSTRHLTVVSALLAALLAGASGASAALTLAFEDPLTSDQPVAGESAKTVSGGSFVAQGWKSTSTSSQMVITLADAFPANASGALELDITGFDPVSQYSGDKHQFFNLYSRPDGAKDGWKEPGKCWWNVRGGSNYKKSGGAGFKLLAAPRGVDSRHEKRLIESTRDWDPKRTYTFRVEWDAGSVWLCLGGRDLSGKFTFGDRTEELRYVFLGKDNVYPGFSGPVYAKLRVYRDAAWLARRRIRARGSPGTEPRTRAPEGRSRR